MPDTIISEHLHYPCPYVLDDADWLQLSYAFSGLDGDKQKALLTALNSHTGVSLLGLHCAINALTDENLTAQVQKQTLYDLKMAQDLATSTIEQFKSRTLAKTLNIGALAITRAEWIYVIKRFEQQQGQNLTAVFLLSNLSIIRKVNFEDLTKTLSRIQPQRKAKKEYEGDNVSSSKRKKFDYLEDEGVNPLILDSNDGDEALHDKLRTTGVRVTTLVPATPSPHKAPMSRTPGRSLVKPLCVIGPNTFFKPMTPQGDRKAKGRVVIQDATRETITEALPKFNYIQPEAITFAATLNTIFERAGVERRQGQQSIKKASSADVFRAHGVQIKASEGRHHHWAHLIAFFLGGPQDTVNLVPSTAAANYNTLEAIELFIEKKLKSLATEQINIAVEPRYVNEEVIPEVLIYSLQWTEQNDNKNETFYISPKSYQRITKSMHQSIAILREESEENKNPSSLTF